MADSVYNAAGVRTVPIMASTAPTPTIHTQAPSPAAGEPMDINTTAPATTRPSSNDADADSTTANGNSPGSNRTITPDHDRSAKDGASDPMTAPSGGAGGGGGDQASGLAPNTAGANSNHSNNSTTYPSASMPMPVAAAAAISQPKIVQTAFIHKLYNMLEDQSITNLIAWAPSNDSFVMSPSNEFSKVLAQYFKHTNISSFVRQLNMYGFHKVSDVFHNGNNDAMWEFKHGQGHFRRGDLNSLREIKRRASRHTVMHRGPNDPRPIPSQPGTPGEPMPTMGESVEPRPPISEPQHWYDMQYRLQRSEARQQSMADQLGRLMNINQELCRAVIEIAPQGSGPQRDASHAQGEMMRLLSDLNRSQAEEPFDALPSSRSQFFSNIDNAPVSPRQYAPEEQRRPSLAGMPRNNYRPQMPSNLNANARRAYGSIGGPGASSPSPLRSQAPPPPPASQHPLASVESPPSYLARRHTSADIRAAGWPPAPGPAPPSSYGPGPGPPSHWPPSPSRAPPAPEDARLRESLAQYSFGAASQPRSQPTTPPPPSQPPAFSNGNSGISELNSWSWGAASRENRNLAVHDSSAPPTRRGSMAHILNPTDTAEHPDEDDPREEDRKRKRLQ